MSARVFAGDQDSFTPEKFPGCEVVALTAHPRLPALGRKRTAYRVYRYFVILSTKPAYPRKELGESTIGKQTRRPFGPIRVCSRIGKAEPEQTRQLDPGHVDCNDDAGVKPEASYIRRASCDELTLTRADNMPGNLVLV